MLIRISTKDPHSGQKHSIRGAIAVSVISVTMHPPFDCRGGRYSCKPTHTAAFSLIAIRSSPQGEGWRQPPAVRFPEVKAPSGVAPPL